MGRSDRDESGDRHQKRGRKEAYKRRDDDSSGDGRRRSSSKRDDRKKKRKKHKTSRSSRHDRKQRKRSYSSSSSSSSEDERRDKRKKVKVENKRLLEKLSARGETLEEREQRRSERRAARITAKFGYTAEDNPFNDPNLHEGFSWKKKEEKVSKEQTSTKKSRAFQQEHMFDEIEKVRQRREDRQKQFEEMERRRAEESRIKEQENYDEWARKEEEFHLQQQRQRSAIRLVEGREKPVDVLAKNLLMFGLSDEQKKNRSSVKYEEKYNAMEELETLEIELEAPHQFLKLLKLQELNELLSDIDAFRRLEHDAIRGTDIYDANEVNPILMYWDALHVVTCDEIEYLRAGGAQSQRANTIQEIQKLFEGQSAKALTQMKQEIINKIQRSAAGATMDAEGVIDTDYWKTVLNQLDVHVAKLDLTDLHSKMLVRQLEKLEMKKEALQKAKDAGEIQGDKKEADNEQGALEDLPQGVEPDFGDKEDELGEDEEIELNEKAYAWQDKFRPRKPRYFNRVKTGYDWNKYNQTHYDHDNPPPKIVQGYKFNVFYPDLIDKTRTPQYVLEPADSDEFCILRFRAGPPYEDIAFKIINREWNRSRKHGFRSVFERGVLTLYFNFSSHWYRR